MYHKFIYFTHDTAYITIFAVAGIDLLSSDAGFSLIVEY